MLPSRTLCAFVPFLHCTDKVATTECCNEPDAAVTVTVDLQKEIQRLREKTVLYLLSKKALEDHCTNSSG